MISTSITAELFLELTIICLVAAAIFISISQGLLRRGRMPRYGRVLLVGGLAIACIGSLLDLLFLFGFPYLGIAEQTVANMNVGRLDYQWIGSLVSLVMITTGVIVVWRQHHRIDEKLSRSESIATQAQNSVDEYERRLNSMLGQSSEAVYCFEFRPPIPVNLPVEEQVARSFDAVLIECNKAFAVAIGKETREEAVGTRLRDMRTIMSAEAHEEFHREFVINGYYLADYEFSFIDHEGNRKLLLISATGDLEDGKLVRLWGTDRNILEHTRIRDKLAGRLKSQEFATRMSMQLLLAQAEEIEDVLNVCLKEICAYMGGDRVTIVWLDKEKRTAESIYYWIEGGNLPWKTLSLDDLPFVGPKLLQGIPVVVNSLDELAQQSSVDAELVEKIGAKAFAAVPLVIAGEIVGVCTVADMHHPRTWSSYDVSDLQTFAALIANVVFRITANAKLNETLAELQSVKDRLEAENIYLREEISHDTGSDDIIGQSESLKRCLHKAIQVAATNTAVLVQGETGTGKELMVRAIHQNSDRRDRPLVKVNCAALPASLIESELFGHERGAFTGAVLRKRGRFDLADGGTLFLDEIGDFPLELQAKLLRVLQEGEFQRVGGTETIKVDVRLIAATNRELQIAVDNGQFRADLYYRISVYPINLPPLREREGDVRLLAEHFVHKHAPRLGKKITAISAAMMEQLDSYSWPGNVRELESVIQRALISAHGPTLRTGEVLDSGHMFGEPKIIGSTVQPVDLLTVEKAHIERVLDQAGWVVAGSAGAAVKLGVPPSTLRSKMKKLGIRRPT